MNRPHFASQRQNRGVHRASEGRSLANAGQEESGFAGMTSLPSVEQLRKLMHGLPEAREMYLDEIRAKIASGEYFTREAAERTADSMLHDLSDAS